MNDEDRRQLSDLLKRMIERQDAMEKRQDALEKTRPPAIHSAVMAFAMVVALFLLMCGILAAFAILGHLLGPA